MQLETFSRILDETDRNFNALIEDLPQYQSFLKKSSLVISLGATQIPFKKELTVFDHKSIVKFLKDSVVKDDLVALNDMIDRLEEEQKAMVKQKRTEGIKELTEKLTRVKKESTTFPIEELEVDDGIDIFVIFPGINIEAIQVIKSHSLMNQEKICRCGACIRAYLY